MRDSDIGYMKISHSVGFLIMYCMFTINMLIKVKAGCEVIYDVEILIFRTEK